MSLLTSLVSYWKLDEASGNALDSHGANELVETSGTIASTTGKVGNCRDFEVGDTEYFEIADNAALSTGDIDFSFSLWINAETLASFPAIFGKHGSATTNHEYALYYDTTASRLTFVVTNASSSQTSVQWGSALSTATWYHVVIWHDATGNVIGIAVNNGTPVTAAHTTGVRDGTQPFKLGAANTSGILYWDGLIDEVGFWKKVLSSDERTLLYNGGNGLPYPFAAAAKANHYRRLRAA